MRLERSFAELLLGVAEWPLLLAVRQGLVRILPLIITGAAALLILNLPLDLLQQSPDSGPEGGWRRLFGLIQDWTIGIAALAVVVSISHAYTKNRPVPNGGVRVSPILTSTVCLAAYFILASPLEGRLEPGFFNMSGGFPIALCAALSGGPLFVLLAEINPLNRYFKAIGADPDVRDTLAAMLPAGATVLIFGLVRLVLIQAGWDDLHHQARTLFGAPFEGAGPGLTTGLGYVALSQLLWFFGIHGPNLLIGVEESILLIATQANIQAAAEGLAPAHILTKPFIDAFVHIGGSGSTLALILAVLIRSRERNTRRLVWVALIPALFNVNEVILLGLPLVLNPVYLLPFLLAPVLQLAFAYGLTALGLVPLTTGAMHWTSPLIIGGYAATSSVAGPLLQIACVGLGTVVYLPFVGLANSIHDRRFGRALVELSAAAESTALNPSGKRCIGLPGQTGLIAEGLAADLESALADRDQIHLVYQPQIDLDRKIIVGAEALLRWSHPDHGPIPPHVTVALAEDTGLIHELGMSVLGRALNQQAALLDKGLRDKVLSVNMSAPQLENDLLVGRVMNLLEETGFPSRLLKIEVTESIALTPEARPLTALRRLRRAGVAVAIDDFGMGHTSLRYLREFPVDTVKIDRSLTRESADGVNDHIITSIVSLCQALAIQIIIEGVETPDQLARFRAHGCSIYQGYLFSRPLALEDYVRLVRAGGRGLDWSREP